MKTKELMLLLLLLIGCVSLYADQIVLPDEVITDSIKITPDSAFIKPDLSQYQRFNKLDGLSFQPAVSYSAEDATKPHNPNASQLLIDGQFGLKPYAKLGVAYNDPKREWAKAKFQLYTRHQESNWNQLNYSLSKPLEYGHYQILCSLNGNHYQTTSNLNTNAVGMQISLNKKDTTSPFPKNILDSDFFISIYRNVQKNSYVGFTDEDYWDVDLGIEKAVHIDTLDCNFKYGLYFMKEHLFAEMNTAFLSEVPWLNEIGLWNAFEKHYYASLLFSRTYQINDKMSYSLSNKPEISHTSRINAITANPWSWIKISKFQVKKPLNLDFHIKAAYDIPVTFGNCSEYLYDTPIATQTTRNGLYVWLNREAYINQTYATAYVPIKTVPTEFSATYFYYNVVNYPTRQIPFAPVMQLKLASQYSYKKIDTTTEMKYLLHRKNSFNENMKNVLIIDESVSYPFRSNLLLYGGINNLLNQDYMIYQDTPKQGIELFAGFQWKM